MATNLFQNGGVNSNWSTTGNWSQGTVPTAGDGHTTRFDATSPNCTVDAVNRVANIIDFTGYTNTIAFGARSITVSGAITLGAAMIATGTGSLIATVSANITSNGYLWPINFQFTGTSQTYTLQDDLNISTAGALSLNGTTALTINNNGTAKVIYAGQNVSSSAGGCIGTAKIVMNGTGNWSSTAAVQNDFEINTAGTVTFGTNVRYAGGTFTYTAGTVVTTTSTFNLGLSGVTTTTVNAAGITFNNVTLIQGASAVITLSADMNITGLLNSVTSGTINGSAINIGNNGSLAVGGGASGIITGTTVLNFTGATCSWLTGSGSLRLTTNINTAGTLTCSGTAIYGTGTLTHIAGTVVTTGHTLTIQVAATLDTDPIVWNNFTISASLTITLTSNLTLIGTLSSNGTSNFNGAFTVKMQGAMALGGSSPLAGTSTMSLESGGSWTGGSGILRMNTSIASGAGSFTIVGGVNYNTGTLTYVSGTLVTTGATVTITTATLNTTGTTFESIVFPGGTVTLNSLFAATTITFAVTSNVTLAGTSGFTITNFTALIPNRAIILKNGFTYTVTGTVLCTGSGSVSTSPNSVTLQSDLTSSSAFFNLTSGGICQCRFMRAIDIDSSGGRQMYTVKGLTLRTTNWLRTTPDWYEFF